MNAFILRVQGQPQLPGAQRNQVLAALSSLVGADGPLFVDLCNATEGVQACGGGGRYTVEWWHVAGAGHIVHWIAGHATSPKGVAEVQAGSRTLRVLGNEVLKLADVQAIFLAFLAGEVKPSAYVWRAARVDQPAPAKR